MPDYRGRIHKEYKWEDLLEKLIHPDDTWTSLRTELKVGIPEWVLILGALAYGSTRARIRIARRCK